MAYATVQDLIDRYGAVEMIRLTVPAEEALDGVDATVANTKLEGASALIDSYVGKRYAVPMEIAPPVITDACCAIARYNLSNGGQKTPSEEMRVQYKDTLDWLRDIAAGRVVLSLDEVKTGGESYSRVKLRPAAINGAWD